PAGRPPSGYLGEDLGRACDPSTLVLALQPADILVLETVGGDLVALGDKGADPVGIDMRKHPRDGEGRLEVVSPQDGEQRGQPLIGTEFGFGGRPGRGANAVRPGCDAEVDGEPDTTARIPQPADFVVGEALLVRDRVAFLPGHGSGGLGPRW